jgi:hypothetical protein
MHLSISTIGLSGILTSDGNNAICQSGQEDLQIGQLDKHMKKTYKVNLRVWLVGGLSLKKDDTITVKAVNNEAGTMLVDNQYMERPTWVFKDDFFVHCIACD